MRRAEAVGNLGVAFQGAVLQDEEAVVQTDWEEVVPHAFVVVVVRIEEEVHRIAGEDVEMAEAGRPFEEEVRGNWEEGLPS